jgi:hypothetical protein
MGLAPVLLTEERVVVRIQQPHAAELLCPCFGVALGEGGFVILPQNVARLPA